MVQRVRVERPRFMVEGVRFRIYGNSGLGSAVE